MEFTGTVTGIKFRNEENGWTVLRIKGDDGEELTAVGVMPSVNDGERVTVTGQHDGASDVRRADPCDFI